MEKQIEWVLGALPNIVKIIILIIPCLLFIRYSHGEDANNVNKLILELRNRSAPAYVRMSAAEVLGKIKDPCAVDTLIATLNDGVSDVRQIAVWALGKIKDIRAIEPLIAALKDDDSDIRLEAVSALGEIKDIRAVDALIATLKDRNSSVQGVVVKALAKIGIPAIKSLINSLKDENSNVGRGAMQALWEIKDTCVVIELLIAALKGEDSDVRWGAAMALREIKDISGAEFLIIAALKDEILNAREDAKIVLVKIIAKNYSIFIQRGILGSETFLIKALNEYGTAKMAEDFLNCGNSQLDKAGREWASRYGYSIFSYSSNKDSPRWGEHYRFN